MPNAEQARVLAADAGAEPWRDWGPYVAERAWGTVREDYSANGDAWRYLPHDHARSRAYRWNEDGMAAVCDGAQLWCLGLALWNGVDPILKERMFGLTGHEGNHGEDVKEYWYYLDSTPTHSWMTWRYHYPQRAFPYDDLVGENARRTRRDREYELIDTGVFDDDRYWAITVDYAKSAPHDLVMRITVENRGPDEADIDVLPTLWFRNTWAWSPSGSVEAPTITADGATLVARHPVAGTLTMTGRGEPSALCCDNETNNERLFGIRNRSRFSKDGINDHIVHGAATVNPDGVGTKAALHYHLTVAAGTSAEIVVRLADVEPTGTDADVLAARQADADTFFADLVPSSATADEARVVRQAVAGLMWGKQFYHYDVATWLDGDPAGPTPPPQRLTGRNSRWRHLDNLDVISMPDAWEYPWYAAWDLAFHCVPIAHVDPAFAKGQLLLIHREWYQHPDGQTPAYEWAFGDANPPVQAWAALRVFEIDGSRDYDFLERIFHKLLLNFTWWVNQKDREGDNVFEGGFLGLDNIGPIDRSDVLPVDGELEQSDGTAWMAMYALNLLEIALVLAEHDAVYEDLAVKFFEHFAFIAQAMLDLGLWDEHDGFFYDVVKFADGTQEPIRTRSVVGLVALCATTTIGTQTLDRLPYFADRFSWFLYNKPRFDHVIGATHVRDGHEGRLLSIVGREQLGRILSVALDETEFLSPHGLRALSRFHRDHPYSIDLGGTTYTVDYEPAESTSALFGGNSNWRGPVWFPVNFLIQEAIRRFARFFGDDLTVELPTGSGRMHTLTEVADELSRRLVGLFVDDADGRRTVFGDTELFQRDASWHDLVPFYEYFDGDTGRGLGASHQTGWTALVADLIIRPHGHSE